MSERNSNIDKLFKDYLVGYESQAPEGAWNRLNNEMRKSRSAVTLWVWRAAAAVILLLLTFAAGYFFSDYKKATNTQIALETLIPDQPETKGQEIKLPDKTKEQVAGQIKAEPNIQADQPAKKRQNPAFSTKDKTLASEANQAEIVEDPAFDTAIVSNDFQEVGEDYLEIMESEATIAEEEIATTETIAPQEIPTDPEYLKQLLNPDMDYYTGLEEKDEKSSTSNWSFGPRVAPVYAYRSLGADNSGTSFNSYYNEVEDGIIALGAAINLNYKFSKRWSLNTGMYVSRIGQENNQVYAVADPGGSGMYKLSTSSGAVYINPKKFESVMIQQQVSAKDTIPGGYLVNGSFVQNLDYFEVPFVMQYKVMDQRFSVNILGGLSPGVLVNNRSYFENDGQKLQTGIVENVNPTILNSLLGIGFDYSISKKVSINMEPTFKYSLSPISTEGNTNNHPYSFSWFTGITYRFY